MLKKIRIGLAIFSFVLLTFYFLDFSFILPENLQSLTKIQLVPALLSLSLGILLILLIITLVFGRVYCSIICPLGIYQDFTGRLANLFRKKKLRHKFRKSRTGLRWSVLLVVIISYFTGLGLILDLLDPYSMYGRMTVHLFRPLYLALNNGLEHLFTAFNDHTFYKVDIPFWGWGSFIIALLSLLLVSFMAWRYGRSWCNTICPVGTVLGYLSKFSVFRLSIDHAICNQCGLCSFNCKASCIDTKTENIDYSRCVSCFNCIDSCNKKAVQYRPFWKTSKPVVVKNETDTSKRQFLSVLMLSSIFLPKAMATNFNEELVNGLRPLKRIIPLMPPGAGDRKHFNALCTSCHLCVSKCPANILQPSLTAYGLNGMMQPVMQFDRGFCNYDCTLCTQVCPSGALKTLTKKEKHLTQMGRVVFVLENCIVYRNETHCGACSEHCPTQALKMVPYKNNLTIPEAHPDICVGCGGCEYICPVEPYKAVFVEGHEIQQAAKAFEDEQREEVVLDDFGF